MRRVEAAGTPTPAAPPPAEPPPPAGGVGEGGRASGGWRALAVVLALALAFAAAVMILLAVDLGENPICEDVGGAERATEDCFDVSATQKTISMILAWPAGILGAIAALMSLYLAVTGRRGRLVLQLAGAAVVLGALSILIGSV